MSAFEFFSHPSWEAITRLTPVDLLAVIFLTGMALSILYLPAVLIFAAIYDTCAALLLLVRRKKQVQPTEEDFA